MKAVVPVFDENRNTPYYLQLYDYLKKAIISREIAEGERLPSLRALAKQSGLSITTIEQGYNQLLVEGYIYSKPHSGYYVNRVLPASSKEASSSEDDSVRNILVTEDTMAADLPEMQYDPECFDFNKWKKCVNRVLTDYSPQLMFESNPQGEASLRNEIARYLYLSRGVSCTPQQIIIGAGIQQITMQLSTLLRRISIEHVAMETPGYQPVKNAFRDAGFAITEVQALNDGINIEKLPSNIRTAAYVSPSNNAFTGSVMPVGRRYELIEWARQNDSYIIEDDYDSELRYFGRPIPALKSIESGDRVIYLGSFSSTLFAAVKISYMVLPISIVDKFNSILNDYSQTCSKLEQLSLAMFMRTGNYQTHIRKLRKLYAQKLSRITDCFRAQASDFVTISDNASGINIILHIRSDKTAEELKKDAEKVGIHAAVTDSSYFNIPESVSLLLYYNQTPLQDIPQVVTKLVSFWRS